MTISWSQDVSITLFLTILTVRVTRWICSRHPTLVISLFKAVACSALVLTLSVAVCFLYLLSVFSPSVKRLWTDIALCCWRENAQNDQLTTILSDHDELIGYRVILHDHIKNLNLQVTVQEYISPSWFQN